MNMDMMRSFLGWGAILNLTLLIVWFLLIVFARDLIYSLHRRWFSLSRETLDAIHYAGMAWYKLSIWLLFIMPYFALCLAR